MTDIGAAASTGASAGAQQSVDEQGGIGIDIDARAVAVAAGAAASAAACAATGVGAVAAPLCGLIGGFVSGVIVDKIIGPIGDFFSGLFGKEEIEPTLVPGRGDTLNLWYGVLGEDGPFAMALTELTGTAYDIGLQGWRFSNTLDVLAVVGELAPQTEAYLPHANPTFQMSPDFHAVGPKVVHEHGWTRPSASDAYMADVYAGGYIPWRPNFQAEYVEAFKHNTLPSDPAPSGYTVPQVGAPIRLDLLQAFIASRVTPWHEALINTWLPETVLRIQNFAIAAEVERATWQAIAELPPHEQEQLRELAAIAQLSAPEQEQLRQYAAIAALSPAEQEQLRQWAQIQNMTPDEQAQLAEWARLAQMSPEDRAKMQAAFGYTPRVAPVDRSAGKAVAFTGAAAAAGTALSYLPRLLGV